MKELPIEVADNGMTIVKESSPKIRCAMDWNDLDSFKDHLVDRLFVVEALTYRYFKPFAPA